MKKAKYYCIEGIDGVGKSTQTQLLVDALRSQGFSVLQTKEPGVSYLPLTMKLREIMLDAQYNDALTKDAREFISQAIRSIHLEKLIVPALYEYDYIIQDRGILSGYAYGVACGNDYGVLQTMTTQIIDTADEHGKYMLPLLPEMLYDKVILLDGGGDAQYLNKAISSKQEFVGGDAIESRGENFMKHVANNMFWMANSFNTVRIDIGDKSINEVHSEILTLLELEKK